VENTQSVISHTIPAAYTSHPLVVRFANDPNWINWELTPTGKKSPKSLWTPTSKDDLWQRPHLQSINSHEITNGITFLEAYAITRKFNACKIGFIPVGTDVGCLDCDLKGIADAAEREAVLAAHLKLCEEFDTFTERSINGGLHCWFELTDKNGLEHYKRLSEHLELFINHNFVTINSDPKKRNGKSIFNRQDLLIKKYPQIVSGNGHVRNGHVSTQYPTMPTGGDAVPVAVTGDNDELWTGPIDPLTPEDEQLCWKASQAKNGEKFKSLYRGEIPENQTHSEADLAFCNIVAFYTDSKEQVVRIFHNCELGKRVKAHREDYLHDPKYGIITKAFDRKPLAAPPKQPVVTAPSPSPLVTPFPLRRIFDKTAPLEYIVPGLILCGGITLLTGSWKSGKSTFMSRLAYDVSTGQSFLGFPAQPPRPVLTFDYENWLSLIQERFTRLKITDVPGWEYWGLDIGEVPHPSASYILTAIERMNPRPLVIIDSYIASFKRLFPNGNENSAGDNRQWYNLLDPLKRLGCGIGVLDHTDRENQKDSRGSGEDIRATGATSLRQIATALNERHIPAPWGGKWHPGTVRRILN